MTHGSDPTRPTPATESVAQLCATTADELGQLLAHRLVDRRGLKLFKRLAVDLSGPHRGVSGALALPAVEVLRGGEQRSVEALAEALERVHGAEEVPAGADLGVGAEGEAVLVELHRREFVAQLAQQLDVDDELLVARHQPAL